MQVRVADWPVQTRRANPQPLKLPVTVCGKLDRPEQTDVYSFEAKKGQKLAFRIDARSLGFLLDPVLRVTDAAGKTIGEAQPKKLGDDVTLEITPPQDGPYRLAVRDLSEEGGTRHVYLLSAGPPQPDYTLTVAADRFTLPAGKPLEIPVTIARQNGHSQPIELSVEGLPAGIEAAITDSKTGKLITLRQTERKEPFAGPIRIVGQTAEAGSRPHLARATIAELNHGTADLWLTLP
jgi:hypothetical protein